ncbi:MAG: HAD family hydrolase [Clostridia bacterium]|nr:HAD family hydrolase [Clostridia bacterium]
MKYRMFVTDYDDTFLRSDHTVLPETLKTIREYEKKGGKFVIATGRMLSTILKTVKPYGLKGEIIAFQGGVVADVNSGEIYAKKYVDKTAAAALLSDLQGRGCYIQVYNGGNYYVNRYTPRTERYALANSLEPVVVGEDIAGFVAERDLPLDKIVFGLDDYGLLTYAQIEPVIKEFQAKYGELVFNSSNTLLIEAVSKGCTKGEAVAFVAARNGIKREEVICIGDSLNDASMVSWAGLGVAVDNATHDLKEVADVITVSCDEDAVGKIIREYCL